MNTLEEDEGVTEWLEREIAHIYGLSRRFIIGMGSLTILPFTFLTRVRYLFFASFIAISSMLYTGFSMFKPIYLFVYLSVCCLFCLSMLLNLSFYQFVSVSVLQISSFLVLLVTVQGSIEVAHHGVSDDIIIGFHASLDMLFAFPIVALSFECHVHNVVVMRELRNPTTRRSFHFWILLLPVSFNHLELLVFDSSFPLILNRQNWVIGLALCLCVFLYVTFGIFGYFLYPPHPAGDLLKCFGNSVPEVCFFTPSVKTPTERSNNEHREEGTEK